MQVVNALIKNKKTFDLLVIPGANHGNGGPYRDRKRYDFFVHHLLGVEPPDWNRDSKIAELVVSLLANQPIEIDEAASFFDVGQASGLSERASRRLTLRGRLQ
jgi:hypothetical protein